MKVKRSVREWFAATLRGNELAPARGCRRVVVEIGDEITEKSTRDSHRSLCVNIGDRLLLCGASLEQIAIAEVRWVKLDGYAARIYLSLGAGAVNDGAVQVMRMRAAEKSKSAPPALEIKRSA